MVTAGSIADGEQARRDEPAPRPQIRRAAPLRLAAAIAWNCLMMAAVGATFVPF
jgi:hypothetical protein